MIRGSSAVNLGGYLSALKTGRKLAETVEDAKEAATVASKRQRRMEKRKDAAAFLEALGPGQRLAGAVEDMADECEGLRQFEADTRWPSSWGIGQIRRFIFRPAWRAWTM